MSETQAEYVTKRREKSTSPDTSERELFIEADKRVVELGQSLGEERAWVVHYHIAWLKAMSRIDDLQEALDRAKQRELNIMTWLQEKNAWAKAWKEKARHGRRAWLRGMPIPPNWKVRQKSVVLGAKWWTR